MSPASRPPAMERLIRRSLKNGIKTLSGKNNRLDPTPTLGAKSIQAKVITYQNDPKTFLTLLQYDAAQIDRSFDQGQNAQEFAELVAAIQSQSAEESAP